MNTPQYASIEATPVSLPQHGADCRAVTAFRAGRDTDLGLACNTPIHLRPWDIFPASKRAIMTFVTVTIVPSHDARGAPMILGWPKVPYVRNLIQQLRQRRLCHPMPPGAVVPSQQPLPVEKCGRRSTSGYVMLVETDIRPDIPWPFP
jgi:hypothetical protein